MSLKMVEYTCEYEPCGATFQRRSEGKKKYRFCSERCGNLARRKVTAEMLLPYADRGACSYQIAKGLKINNSAVLPALRRFGLYRLWTSRRYKKCAPPSVGPSSATTASGAQTSPSARSEALMAGDMSYGG